MGVEFLSFDCDQAFFAEIVVLQHFDSFLKTMNKEYLLQKTGRVGRSQKNSRISCEQEFDMCSSVQSRVKSLFAPIGSLAGSVFIAYFTMVPFLCSFSLLYSVHFHHSCVAHHDETSTRVDCSALFKTDQESAHTCPLTLQLRITRHCVGMGGKLEDDPLSW